MTSFGSGAGSDAFSISVKDKIDDIRCGALSVRDYIGEAEYLDYAMYAKHKGKLRDEDPLPHERSRPMAAMPF